MLSVISGVDHPVILVRDLDVACRAMERLGFTVSPRGHHSAHMGSANHTIMLAEDYFELLGVVTPTEKNRQWRERLDERGEGLNGLALRSVNAVEACAQLRAAGIDAADPIEFRRPVELPDGVRRDALFTVTRLPTAAMPHMSMFIVAHHTRDLVWLPELMGHANSACGIASITVVADEPHLAMSAYQKLVGTGNVIHGPDGVLVHLGKTDIIFIAPAALATRYPGVALDEIKSPAMLGMSITVTDLSAARACVEKAGIRIFERDGGLYVAPADACGVVLEFTENIAD